jgi:molybdopterin-guanine dinucleotide biosynthesis protein A
MIRKAVSEGKDIVVPRGGDGNIEPLHAVYRKSVLPLIDEALEEGERKVRSIYDRCETDYFDLPEEMELVNLNTRVDYKEYCTGKDR